MLNKVRVEELLKLGFSNKEIAQLLNSNIEAVKKYIYRNFKELVEEMKEKNLNQIEQLYEMGYSSKEIENKIGIDNSTIRNYISLNLVHLKEIHDREYKKRKETKKEDERLLRKENDRFMSVREFVMRNTNCYDQQKDGSYVFNSKSGVATWDAPIRYTPSI